MLMMAAAREELGELDGEVVGVGPIMAAVRAATLIAQQRPTGVVLVGTAGAYAGGPSIGTAIASTRLGLSYGVAALGLGYVPRAPPPVPGDSQMLARLDLPGHAVLTVGAITTDPALAGRLSEAWTVEHLEAFGVAWACHQAGVPFVAVLGITNDVGPEAHVQWLTHRDHAQAAARDAVAPLRARGAADR